MIKLSGQETDASAALDDSAFAQRAKRLETALSSDKVKKAYQNSSKEQRDAFDNLYKKTQSASKTLSDKESQTESNGVSASLGMRMASTAANADDVGIANAIHSSPNFRLAALQAQMAASQNPVLQSAINDEERAMQTGQRSGASVADKEARTALATMRALGRVAGQVPSAEQKEALSQLTNMFAAFNDQALPEIRDPNKKVLEIGVPSAAPSAQSVIEKVDQKVPPPEEKPPGIKTPKPVVQRRATPISRPPAPGTPSGTPSQPVLGVDAARATQAINKDKDSLNAQFDQARKNAQDVGLVKPEGKDQPGVIKRAANIAWQETFGNGPDPTNLNGNPKK